MAVIQATDNSTCYVTSSPSMIWNNWNIPLNTYTTGDTIWTNWISMGGSAATTGNVFWTAWNSNQPLVVSRPFEHRVQPTVVQEIPKKKQPNPQEIAERKAELLLLQHLDRQQGRDWKKRGYFDMRVRSGRRYRLHRGKAGNVHLRDEHNQRDVAVLCCHPSDYQIPMCDVVLGQMMMLKFAEMEFWKTTNITLCGGFSNNGNNQQALKHLGINPYDQVAA